MAVAVATRPAASRASGRRAFRSAAELREVFTRLLGDINADDRVGPLLAATRLRLRIVCPDVKGVVAVWADGDRDAYVEWRFDRRGGVKPKLELTMDSDVLNEWLQGRESVPMAIAHRRMRCSGDARVALLYLPVLKLMAGPYRRLVESGYPHLAL